MSDDIPNQVFPDCGYVLDELYYEAGPGGRSPIYSQSFWMPARNITVCATFKLYREDVTNILFLPNGLTALEDEAFAGVAAQGVRIPSSVMTIQSDPFADSSVKCVFGYGGSAAQVFADLHGYDFVDITPYYVTEGV